MSLKTEGTFIKYDTQLAVENGTNNGLAKIGALTVAQAKALMIPDTGLLRNSVMYKLANGASGGFNDGSGESASEDQKLIGVPDRGVVVVGTNVKYAPYEEFGTRNRGAKPFLRPAVDIVVRGNDGKKAMEDALDASFNKAKIKSKKGVL